MDPSAGRLSAIEAAFAGFGAAVAAVDDARDRKALIDCARSALDRGAARLDNHAPTLVAGTFWVEETIADGAFSTVSRLRHRDLSDLHALKTLQPPFATDPVHVALALREARHHLAVRHPAVTPATAALRLDDGRPALLMAFVDGPSLDRRLDAGPLALEETLNLGLRLAAGIAAIHATGVVHLDLAPGNVLLPNGDPSRAQICDFGLSLPIGGRRSPDDVAVAGTPGFAAPEQADPDRPLDARADLFALGAVLARAGGGDAADAARPRFAALLDTLRAPDPERRPGRATDVTEALQDIRARLEGAA